MDSDVSVVIPVFNGERFIRDAIGSVLNQTFLPAKIVVVDDGSTDATAAIVSEYAPAVELVRQANRGVAGARNTGAALCDTDFLAFLDADDYWYPTKLDRQLQALHSGDFGFAHCGVLEIDEKGNHLRTRLDGRSGDIARDLVRFERSAVLGGGSAAVFDSTVFWSLGGFDTELSTAADWDLFVRIACERPVAFVHEPLVAYRIHGSNMHRNVAAMEHDMKRAMGKVLATNPKRFAADRRAAHGNLHYALGGSYVNQRSYVAGARHLARALAARPQTAVRIAQAVRRRVR